MNCSVLSDVAQLKARQRDVRPFHPEDMMQDEILVRPLAAVTENSEAFAQMLRQRVCMCLHI